MALLPMKRMMLLGLNKDREAILESLQHLSSVEIIEDKMDCSDDPIFSHAKAEAEIAEYDSNAALALDSLKILDKYSQKKYAFGQIKGKHETAINKEKYAELLKKYDSTFDAVQKIIALESELEEIRSELPRAEASAEEIRPWASLDIPMDYKGSTHTAFFVGVVYIKPEEKFSADAFADAVEAKENGMISVEIITLSVVANKAYIAAICHKSEESAVVKALGEMGFRQAERSDMIPSEEFKKRDDHIKELKGRMAEITAQLESLGVEREAIKFYIDYSHILRERQMAAAKLTVSEHTFILNGWIAEKDIDSLNESLSGFAELEIEYFEHEADEKPPIRLQIKGLSVPVGGVIELSEKIHSGGRHEFTPFGVHTKYFTFEGAF